MVMITFTEVVLAVGFVYYLVTADLPEWFIVLCFLALLIGNIVLHIYYPH